MRRLILNCKKGFSLFEATIAMALIAISCALTLGIIQKANSYNNESNALDAMRQISRNGMEIFKFSESKNEFHSYLSIYYPDLTFYPEESDEITGTYSYFESVYGLTMIVTYNGEDVTYKANCSEIHNLVHTTVFEINYRKYC